MNGLAGFLKSYSCSVDRLEMLGFSHEEPKNLQSDCGRYMLAFNGQIYNSKVLYQLLKAADTVPTIGVKHYSNLLLAGFSAWGVEETISRCDGVFSFALWDTYEHCLTITRDRLGSLPLYYGWQGHGSNSTFMFATDLGLLKHHNACGREIDKQSLKLLIRHSYIPAPYSIYKGIYKLPPGHMLMLENKQTDPTIKPYWSLSSIAASGIDNLSEGGFSDTADQLEQVLYSSIKKSLLSSKNVGAFLSGGVDSSVVCAIAQKYSARPIKTFSIGFDDRRYNEATHAKEVASYVGTDHTELYVTDRDAINIIPQLSYIYTEPFADSSQIPTFMASRLAANSVDTVLAGDGGDELFGGYNRYIMTDQLWGKLSGVPIIIRRLLARVIQSASPDRIDDAFRLIQILLPKKFRAVSYGDKLHKAAKILPAHDINDLYFQLVSTGDPLLVLSDDLEYETELSGSNPVLSGFDRVQKMMIIDALTYVPDDINVKVGKSASAAGIKSIAPLIDPSVVEFAWRIPQNMKIRNGVGKAILREVLYRYVPRELIERPKMGFGMPLDRWLRGALRDWAETLIDRNTLEQQGYFNADLVHKLWQEHLSGKHNRQHALWNILMFQSWLLEQ